MGGGASPQFLCTKFEIFVYHENAQKNKHFDITLSEIGLRDTMGVKNMKILSMKILNMQGALRVHCIQLYIGLKMSNSCAELRFDIGVNFCENMHQLCELQPTLFEIFVNSTLMY